MRDSQSARSLVKKHPEHASASPFMYIKHGSVWPQRMDLCELALQVAVHLQCFLLRGLRSESALSSICVSAGALCLA